MSVTDEATQQVGLMLDRACGATSAASETGQIEGGGVGQRIGFQVGPQIFDRIEFWGIGRQVGHGRRVGADAFVQESGQMRLEAVPDQDDGGADLALQVFETLRCARVRCLSTGV